MTKISCKYKMRSSGLRGEVCGAMKKGDLGAFGFLYKEFSLVGKEKMGGASRDPVMPKSEV